MKTIYPVFASAYTVVCGGIHINNIDNYHPHFVHYSHERKWKIYKSIALISFGYGITWPIHTYISIRDLLFSKKSNKCPVYRLPQPPLPKT